MITQHQIHELAEKAYDRIQKYIFHTPLYHQRQLSTPATQLYLKCENLQYTSSFKLRGAASKLTALQERGIDRIITASTGNHGMAVAYMLGKLNMNGTIYVPNTIKRYKEKQLGQFGVNIIRQGIDSGETESKAREISEKENIPYISPYNDPEIIAGQASMAIELLNEIKRIDNIFITVGGGGMISGIAAFLKSQLPDIKVYGCQPENSPVMFESIKEGKIVQMTSKETLSDGSAGGIEPDAITFDLCRELVDEFLLVSEKDIKGAVRTLFATHRLIVEGAAGVALAAYLRSKSELQGNTVVILCGGNIAPEKWLEIINMQ